MRPPNPTMIFDNTDPGLFEGIGAAMQALFAPSGSTLKVTGTGTLSSQRIDITIDQTTLTARLWRLSRNFFILSIIISAALMAALWAALWVMVIRPVRRLTSSIIAFGADPQDTRRVIAPSGRHDDIGRAEAALAEMQGSLAHELSQRKRLAELGMAVARINHDLRNMLRRRAIDVRPPGDDRRPARPAACAAAGGDARPRHRILPIDADLRRRARTGADPPPLRPARNRARKSSKPRKPRARRAINFAIDIPPNFEICRRSRTCAPRFREFEPQRDAGFEPTQANAASARRRCASPRFASRPPKR